MLLCESADQKLLDRSVEGPQSLCKERTSAFLVTFPHRSFYVGVFTSEKLNL